jgi:hypothetical protein
MLAVEYDGMPVMFTAVGRIVGAAAEVTYGNETLFVGVIVFSAGVIEKVGSAPNSLSGMAVPTPVPVHGVGTGRREVTGLAWGLSEYIFRVSPLGREISPDTRLAMAPDEEL